MHKIAIIGSMDNIYSFASIGIEIFPCENFLEAISKIKELSSNFGIVFVIENLFNDFPDDIIEEFNEIRTLSVVPIPSINSNNSTGSKNLKKLVKKAIGFDMLEKII